MQQDLLTSNCPEFVDSNPWISYTTENTLLKLAKKSVKFHLEFLVLLVKLHFEINIYRKLFSRLFGCL